MTASPAPPPFPDPTRRRTGRLLAGAMLGTFAVLRAALLVRPDADFNVGPYNIHHLFTGLLVITACAVPLAIGVAPSRARDALVAGLGVGLGLALDEWVYLIATDGSNASYLLPVSFWGGLVVVVTAAAYALLVGARPATRQAAARRDVTATSSSTTARTTSTTAG